METFQGNIENCDEFFYLCMGNVYNQDGRML